MAVRKRQKKVSEKKICTNCGKEKTLSQFYLASNPLTSSDGKMVNICKHCVKSNSLNDDGSLDIEKFKNMLMLMDKPYVPVALEGAIEEAAKAETFGKGRTDIIGNYMKNISSLHQYKKISFLESINRLENGGAISSSVTTTERKNRKDPHEDVYIRQVDDFVVTDEILDLFGEGHSKNTYRKMWNKFEKLKQNYSLQTNLHIEALATYVRFKVKEEEATALGKYEEANKWNQASQAAANNAKLTPKLLTQADMQGGVTSISEIAKACEEAVDIIEILPRFLYQPNDAPDFIIWCYINYCRKLKGLPECEYKDIYEFYDKKKQEYLDQYGDPYGIFTGDTSEKNRDSVERFITLPKDYNGDE